MQQSVLMRDGCSLSLERKSVSCCFKFCVLHKNKLMNLNWAQLFLSNFHSIDSESHSVWSISPIVLLLRSQKPLQPQGMRLLPGQTCSWEKQPPYLLSSFLPSFLLSLTDLPSARGSMEDITMAMHSLAAVAMCCQLTRKWGEDSSGFCPAPVSLSLFFFPLRPDYLLRALRHAGSCSSLLAA